MIVRDINNLNINNKDEKYKYVNFILDNRKLFEQETISININVTFLENIIKNDYSKNKLLVCYQKLFNAFLLTVYQYYSYIGSNLIIDNICEVGRISGDIDERPLILYKHGNSIFIIFDYFSNNIYLSISILCSLDRKINVLFIMHNKISIITINFLNEANNLYSLYEETKDNNFDKSTKLYLKIIILIKNQQNFIVLNLNNFTQQIL